MISLVPTAAAICIYHSTPTNRRWLFSRSIRAFFVLGFRKIDTDQWEFANEDFLCGKKSLLKNINRRRSSQAQQISPYLDSSMEMDLSGKEGELQKLRSEKSMLMLQVVKMKQEHLATVKQMDALNCRMQSSEVRHKQIISFCSKVLQNPEFLMQLKQIKQQKENERSIRKFLKQKQQPAENTVSMSSSQQIFKYRSSFCEPSSTYVLHDLESSTVKQLPDNHLQDVADKISLDASIQQVFGSSDKPLEDVAEKSLDPNASFNLKDPKILEDDSLSSSGFLISFPEEFASEKMVFEPMPPASESFTRHNLRIGAFNSKNVSEVQDVTTCCPQYLASPADDISHELMLKDSLTTVGETWNLCSEAGGSPFTYGLDRWDNIFCNSPEDLQCGISVHAPDKGFDIGQCFGSEVSLQQLLDEGELKEDHPKTTEV